MALCLSVLILQQCLKSGILSAAAHAGLNSAFRCCLVSSAAAQNTDSPKALCLYWLRPQTGVRADGIWGFRISPICISIWTRVFCSLVCKINYLSKFGRCTHPTGGGYEHGHVCILISFLIYASHYHFQMGVGLPSLSLCFSSKPVTTALFLTDLIFKK